MKILPYIILIAGILLGGVACYQIHKHASYIQQHQFSLAIGDDFASICEEQKVPMADCHQFVINWIDKLITAANKPQAEVCPWISPQYPQVR